MAIQKRPCGSLDRSEYVWTHDITEGVFVTVVNRLRQLREKSIVNFLKDHGTTKLIHELQTDEISDLAEEVDTARQKNLSWKLEAISLARQSFDSVAPLYTLDLRGPTRMWRMTIDLLDG